jgi:hypothetical protein
MLKRYKGKFIKIYIMSKLDYLTEDTLLPQDQKFVCLSFLTDKELKTTLSGIKIRGVFATYELACEHAKKLQSVDDNFNVFVGDMGKWLPFDPDPESESVKDSEYANEQLNNMMKTYLENQVKAKIYHEHRKNEMVRENIMSNLSIKKENLYEMQSKLGKTNNKEDKVKLEDTIKSIETQIKTMEDKKKELDTQITDLNDKLQNHQKFELSPLKDV